MDDANVWWIMDNGFVCDVLWMVDVYVMGYGCVCDGIWMCMWYILCCVLIYMRFLCLRWWKAKNKKNSIFPSLPSATLGKEAFAECRDHGTRQTWEPETQFPSFAECQSHDTRQRFFFKKEKILCRVQEYDTRQRIFKKKRKKFFAECRWGGTRQRGRQSWRRFFFCRVLTWHSAKALPSTRYGALGKETFADGFFADCSLPSAALGKAFAECPKHSANHVFPVVHIVIEVKYHTWSHPIPTMYYYLSSI